MTNTKKLNIVEFTKHKRKHTEKLSYLEFCKKYHLNINEKRKLEGELKYWAKAVNFGGDLFRDTLKMVKVLGNRVLLLNRPFQSV